jgi:hypothetical protein
MDPVPLGPGLPILRAHGVADPIAIVPDHVRDPVRCHLDPGPIVKPIFRQVRPCPAPPHVTAHAYRHVCALSCRPVEAHGQEVQRPVRSHGEVDVRIAHGALRVGADVYRLPGRTGVVAPEQLRRLAGLRDILGKAGHEQGASRVFGNHGLANRHPGEVLDGVRQGKRRRNRGRRILPCAARKGSGPQKRYEDEGPRTSGRTNGHGEDSNPLSRM